MNRNAFARTGGGLYLAVGMLGGFAEAVRSSVRVPGDTAATASNIASHAGLLRASVAADLVDMVCFLGVALVLYTLLKQVNAGVAIAMLVINAVSVAITGLNLLNQVGALLVVTDPSYTAGMTAAQAVDLAAMLFGFQHQGYLIAQVFFGLYLAPLGYLVYRSPEFNRLLGVVLVVGSAGYLAGVVATYLSPTLDSSLAIPFGMVGGVAEIAFLVWLLARGVRRTSPLPAPTKSTLGGQIA